MSQPPSSRSNDPPTEAEMRAAEEAVTGEATPSNMKTHYYTPGTVADYIEKAPAFEGICFDQNPPEEVLATAVDTPPSNRLTYLLTLPLKKLSGGDEYDSLRISEDNFLLSDYIRVIIRWAICLSLISTYANDMDTIPVGYLLGHLESILASTGALSFSGKPGGALAAPFYHRLSIRKAAEATRRGLPMKAIFQDLSIMDQNLALRAANEAVAAREKKTKSWRGWQNSSSSNGKNNHYSYSTNNKKSRDKPWNKSSDKKEITNNDNDNSNGSNKKSKQSIIHESELSEDPHPRFFYTSPKIDAAKLRDYKLTGGALEHLTWARQRGNPLRSKPTLPHSLSAAIQAHKQSESDAINESRRKVMNFLKSRASQLSSQADEVRQKMPTDVRAISGRLNIPLLRELILLTDYTDTSLPQDLQEGMDVVGRLPYIKGVFAERQKPVREDNTFMDPEHLLDSSMSNLDNLLEQIKGRGFDQGIWESCLKEVGDDFMEGPITLAEAKHRYGKFVLLRLEL
ncbi:hypothetical protein FOL47_001539 [Perkinsus chesapeaki]|uniref:Uncharacterized protein n=1 Tax=Perkinsus chesapeaki TaxID=330153 RepID=A0A7J6KTP8_PERCH|nr:hypothetical protein FOL47_001539 [Perkinsus chesapeaki]